MNMSAAQRRRYRRLTGALLISLGTAVFSGAVGIVIDALVHGGSMRWYYLAGSIVLGATLSGGGGWLIATLKAATGLAVIATDSAGDADRYQDEADAFARFGAGMFTVQTSLQESVEQPNDLPSLRNRLRAHLRMLAQAEPRATTVGLLFQGRHHVGFHVGRWLNLPSRRVDVFSDSRGGGPDSHFAAIRLGPSIQSAARPLDIVVYSKADGFTEPHPADSPGAASKALAPDQGTPMGLAINLNGPVHEAGFIQPVAQSARSEGLSHVVFVALPAPADRPGAVRRELVESCEDYESTTAAIIEVADRMPLSAGLIYFKTPAAIAPALGHFLRAGKWTPMRYTPALPRCYERFPEVSPHAADTSSKERS